MQRDKEIRALAWVVVKWAQQARPRVIILENVEEFQTWGPLDSEGRIIQAQKGFTFRTFLWQLKRQGYRVETRILKACDYGAPTSRERFFLIARRDGLPIVWPEPTHGPGRPLPYRTAAEIIDWSLPCHSIFLSPDEAKKVGVRRPLKEKTLCRIAKGTHRYVIETAEPFIVNLTHGGRVESINDPVRTITAAHRGEKALVAAHIQRQFGQGVGHGMDDPLATVTAGGMGHSALVAAFMAKHYGGVVGTDLGAPVGTVTSVDHHSLVASNLVKLRGTCRDGQPMTDPMPTVTAGGQHIGEVRAFLTKYFGNGTGQSLHDPASTLTTKDRLGLVIVQIYGEPYIIADIGMRMLSPRELFRAQGFRDDYIIDIEVFGRRISKADQVRMCGNSVPPDVAAMLVQANVVSGQEAGGLELRSCRLGMP